MRRGPRSRLLLLPLVATALVATGVSASGSGSRAAAHERHAAHEQHAAPSTVTEEARRPQSSLQTHNRVSLGDGFVETVYAVDPSGRPTRLGVRVDGHAMRSLPTQPHHDGSTCFDQNGDGDIHPMAECAGGYERELWFPKIPGVPFTWMMFNWQPMGHGPPHVFQEPHLDLHFFIQDQVSRNHIRTGPCNLVINCEDQATATKPVPAPYNPVGWGLPGAAGRMGNHLIDPELPPANGGPFTQAFAYGTYDGHISFWEPVVNTTWVTQAKPVGECLSIEQTPAVEISGWYPTRMCTTYDATGAVTTTLEGFQHRTAPASADPPAWLR